MRDRCGQDRVRNEADHEGHGNPAGPGKPAGAGGGSVGPCHRGLPSRGGQAVS
ncbi:hypothetical protein FRUB_08188 [Fimbriiglobus ruber]|uniref:Uncharacterized protein n=1 Tax=Fimbriiglobus ruber TaxID=1908690 RepID=A0A225DGV4_9BACT|nr:hypothetical protein FRUB_08188 [Fimbriiglobus ruber]